MKEKNEPCVLFQLIWVRLSQCSGKWKFTLMCGGEGIPQFPDTAGSLLPATDPKLTLSSSHFQE